VIQDGDQQHSADDVPEQRGNEEAERELGPRTDAGDGQKGRFDRGCR